MKNILFLIPLFLLLSACSPKKASEAEVAAGKFAKVTAGSAKIEFLKEAPGEVDEDDILFIKVNPGTITVGSLRASNNESFYVMTKPFSKSQLSKLIGTETGSDLASNTPFDFIEKAQEKLAKANPGLTVSLPTSQQWDFAFLSGKINENEQPICWEWTPMEDSNAYTWRGRIWHIMELYDEEEQKKDPGIVQKDLGFRFAFKPEVAK